MACFIRLITALEKLRSFDLLTGAPLNAVSIPGEGFINGVAATDDGTTYLQTLTRHNL